MKRPLMRVAGGALVALPLLPIVALLGDAPGAGGLVPAGEWALGTAIFATVAGLVAAFASERGAARLEAAARALAVGGGRWRLPLLLGLLAALLATASTLVFARHPLLIDSVAELFQAKIFAGGSWTAPAPPLPAFFSTPQMIVEGGRWYSQYPPGHPALLAIGVVAGAPWLVPIALSLTSALLLYGFARRAYDEPTARLTLLLLVVAPFFWFMGASFMNHVSALTGVAGFLYLFARWEDADRAGWLAATGAALGVAFLSRPLTALAVAVPFAAVAAADALRRRSGLPLLAGAAGFLAVAGLYLAYNAATTGDALTPGYIRLWGGSHGLGFHATPWGDLHTPLAGLRNEAVDLALVNGFLFEWPLPALLPLGAALAAGWLDERWDGRLLAGFLAVPATYFFYWHRDAFLGPRFLYAGTVAFAVPLTARALLAAARRLRGRSLRLGGFRPIRATTFLVALVGLAGLYAAGYGVPARFRLHAGGMESMKLDLTAEARAAGIDRGIVFVAVSWGNRLIAELRGLGVSAAAVERAYRQADHCRIQLLVARARREGWSGTRVESALDSLRVGEAALVHVQANGDPSLLLRPGSRLAPECLDEIRYDQGGYTLYTPHLVENAPGLDGPLVFARDLRDRDPELAARLPQRPVWLYRGGSFHAVDISTFPATLPQGSGSPAAGGSGS